MIFNYKHTKKKEKRTTILKKGTNKEKKSDRKGKKQSIKTPPTKRQEKFGMHPTSQKKGEKKNSKALLPLPYHPILERKKNGPLGCMLAHLIG
jgi:hypothetical protein